MDNEISGILERMLRLSDEHRAIVLRFWAHLMDQLPAPPPGPGALHC